MATKLKITECEGTITERSTWHIVPDFTINELVEAKNEAQSKVPVEPYFDSRPTVRLIRYNVFSKFPNIKAPNIRYRTSGAEVIDSSSISFDECCGNNINPVAGINEIKDAKRTGKVKIQETRTPVVPSTEIAKVLFTYSWREWDVDFTTRMFGRQLSHLFDELRTTGLPASKYDSIRYTIKYIRNLYWSQRFQELHNWAQEPVKYTTKEGILVERVKNLETFQQEVVYKETYKNFFYCSENDSRPCCEEEPPSDLTCCHKEGHPNFGAEGCFDDYLGTSEALVLNRVDAGLQPYFKIDGPEISEIDNI